MKFEIVATSLHNYFKRSGTNLIEEYPCLASRVSIENERHIWSADTFIESTYIEINSLDELINLSKEIKIDLIISVNSKGQSIEIYDDYRE